MGGPKICCWLHLEADRAKRTGGKSEKRLRVPYLSWSCCVKLVSLGASKVKT